MAIKIIKKVPITIGIRYPQPVSKLIATIDCCCGRMNSFGKGHDN